MEAFNQSEVSPLGRQVNDRVPASCCLSPPEFSCREDFIEAMDGLNE